MRSAWLLGLALLAILAAVVSVILVVQSQVRVVAVSPPDEADDVAITAPVRIGFSVPMEDTSVEAHVQIWPETRGQFTWQARDLLFWPAGAWAPDTEYTVTLEAGALSAKGRALATGRTWRFRTRVPGLLYLGRPTPGNDARQLVRATFDGRQPQVLTNHPGGVWDYTVHPEGEGVIYSVLRDDGGSDLWRMGRDGSNQRLLVDCPAAACLAPSWSPDGQRVVYERRDIYAGAPNLDPKAGRLWLLELDDGQERPLFEYDVPLHGATWAPGGELLAYASPLLPGLEILNLATKDLVSFANEWDAAPSWSPDGRELVVSDLAVVEEQLVVRLIRIDPASQHAADLSGADMLVKDTNPAWSPAGGWIAFGRQFLDEARWTPGRQVWLTRPDGSEAYALLREVGSDLFGLTWRPDAGALAYLKTDISEGPQAEPVVEVWVFDFQTRASEYVGSGVMARWLP